MIIFLREHLRQFSQSLKSGISEKAYGRILPSFHPLGSRKHDIRRKKLVLFMAAEKCATVKLLWTCDLQTSYLFKLILNSPTAKLVRLPGGSCRSDVWCCRWQKELYSFRHFVNIRSRRRSPSRVEIQHYKLAKSLTTSLEQITGLWILRSKHRRGYQLQNLLKACIFEVA